MFDGALQALIQGVLLGGYYAIIAAGLSLMVGVVSFINLAHGEFLMLGGYVVVVSTNNGVNLWVAMLILAPLIVGIIGVIVERLLIRWLYGRMVDTLLATWGLSLLLIHCQMYWLRLPP
jgi:branched-chain amino acid transport system permease protein